MMALQGLMSFLLQQMHTACHLIPAVECRSCLQTTVASELFHEVSEIVLHVPE